MEVSLKPDVGSESVFTYLEEEYHRFSVLNSHVEFNVFTSDLLTSDMIFTTDMLMRITVYLKQEHSYNPRIDVDLLKDNDRDVLYFGRLKDRNPIILIANSKRDYQLQMTIEPIEYDEIVKIKPYIFIEKLSEIAL
ncbi:hypothetical protein TNCV_3067211 [Trichonephila clavipes]|nr:hypothetical protein TNCV_3067211 [Trichonephila clavipes]